MLRNYLTIAIRSMSRNLTATGISTAGLAIAFAISMLVAVQSLWELSFNTQLGDTSNVYRIIRSMKQHDGGDRYDVHSSGGLTDVFREEHPEVVSVTRFFRRRMFFGAGKHGDQGLFCLAEDNLFDTFAFELVKGDKESFLKEVSAVVISDRFSERLFGAEDPIGKEIQIGFEGLEGVYRIAAVVRIPRNMSLGFDVMATESTLGRPFRRWETWIGPSASRYIETYVCLRPEIDLDTFVSNIQPIIRTHMGARIASISAYHLQSIDRIYLYSRSDFGISHPRLLAGDPFQYGNANRISGAVTISVLILLIAVANFVNLATARASLRTKEVGVRKASGAERSRLIFQFLSESVLLSLIALVIAVGLIVIGRGQMQVLAPSPADFRSVVTPTFIIAALSGSVSIGLLAGLFPAIVLSRIEPVTAMRGTQTIRGGGVGLRRVLTAFQFMVSATLIALTLIVTRQVDHLTTRDIGLNRDQVVGLPLFLRAIESKTWGGYGVDLKAQYAAVKQRFLSVPGVTSATATRFPLSSYSAYAFRSPDAEMKKDRILRFIGIDEDFLRTLEIELVAGRGFSGNLIKQWGRDGEMDFILTETAAREFGWTGHEAVGKRIEWTPWIVKNGPVIGVVEDLHLGTLQEDTKPLVLIPAWRNLKNVYLKIQAHDLSGTMAGLEEVWKSYLPKRPFEYVFLDQQIEALYRGEIEHREMLRTFSSVAVFLSIIGIFGLAAFLVSRRTKEVSIRKVLGAKPGQLLQLLTREYIVLVLVAGAVSVPIALSLSRSWLDSYTHRIDLGLVPFAVAIAICLITAFVTVSVHTVRALRVDPARNLRDE